MYLFSAQPKTKIYLEEVDVALGCKPGKVSDADPDPDPDSDHDPDPDPDPDSDPDSDPDPDPDPDKWVQMGKKKKSTNIKKIPSR